MPQANRVGLDGAVQYLKGVGPHRARLLARLEVRTVRDLLYHAPHRYLDASNVELAASVSVGSEATVVGVVVSKGVIPTRRGLRIFQAVLQDASGLLECAWPGQPFLDRTISQGDLLLVTGPVRSLHGRQLQPREFVLLGSADSDQEASIAPGVVLPVYPATEGLSQKVIRSIIHQNLDSLLPLLADEDPFPPEQLEAAEVPSLQDAMRWLHRPSSLAEAELGRRRLAFEEIFFLQLLHARAHHRATVKGGGKAFRRTNKLIEPLYRGLPFRLTAAQKKALRQIMEDMTSPRRMHRLLQGDVGSGKTVVALFAMLLAVENGCQAALMAPTEILAEQHVQTLRDLLGDLPVSVALLTARLTTSERKRALAQIAGGQVALVVGTHALIQDAVTYKDLGLAVVDEQHRFGVRQRMALADLGGDSDLLVMSATPIPRSLALTLHGDLDLSVLNQLPPGRKPVTTEVRGRKERKRVHEFIRRQVTAGRQAYIVYPLVEESDKLDLLPATKEFEHLAEEVFPDLRVGLLHGQLGSDVKDATMRAFASGELDVLVATTIVEVGIDVPNATVMVVEHAERFGLSQLHQLRGRVGRGGDESFCILIAGPGAETAQRLQIMAGSQDGFEIAAADLQLRGMGEFFGDRQHGFRGFRHFDPQLDEAMLTRARRDARRMIAADPELAREEHQDFLRVLHSRFAEHARLLATG